MKHQKVSKGNISLIVRGHSGTTIHVNATSCFNKQNKAAWYQSARSKLKERFSHEQAEALLRERFKLGNYYWGVLYLAAQDGGIDRAREVLKQAVQHVFGTMDAGNYVFDLTGELPYPHVMSDDEFGKYKQYVQLFNMA